MQRLFRVPLNRRVRRSLLSLGVGLAAGCGAAASTDTGASSSDDGAHGHAENEVVHSFGVLELAPHEETQPCLQWTIGNEQPLYVQTVRLTNDGGSHHSNWFVVPEDSFPGEDGYFECQSRGFAEIEAAVSGTVLFAQSTQSRVDEQRLPDGVVVKIPPHHKVVAGGHFLNLADAPYSTELRMTFELVHPKDVRVVAAPFRLTYYDLDIPAGRQARFGGDCDFSALYQDRVGMALDLKLYYVTPHYHYLGDYFDLSIIGGPRDGEQVFQLDGFDASSNGKSFDPPIDLTGAQGFRFTCGYDNWRDKDIGWGIGDQEMCVMLGLADSAVLMDASVQSGEIVGEQDGVVMNQGACAAIGLPKNTSQAMPTAEEIAAPLYVPPSSPGDADLPPAPVCVDLPADTVAHEPATLTSVSATLFESSCVFSSCHGGAAAAAGLDLRAADLHTTLLDHAVQAKTALPLVAPGDPEGSYLFRLLSQCEPTDDDGNTVAHMPYNSLTLARPELVAKVRDWIAAGAPAN
ncbi:MAG: hypothetical protein IPN32_14010 [Deltaproteobacteria bacterium]|nr:hypothetical protein [Deltaproteobacteria bacterium]